MRFANLCSFTHCNRIITIIYYTLYAICIVYKVYKKAAYA